MCAGDRCCMKTRAKPNSSGSADRKRTRGLRPPAEAPIPTMGKGIIRAVGHAGRPYDFQDQGTCAACEGDHHGEEEGVRERARGVLDVAAYDGSKGLPDAEEKGDEAESTGASLPPTASPAAAAIMTGMEKAAIPKTEADR